MELSRSIDTRISEWGNPTYSDVCYYIYIERTQGSETSQYLKEKKSTEIPKVVANEMGIALNAIGC